MEKPETEKAKTFHNKSIVYEKYLKCLKRVLRFRKLFRLTGNFIKFIQILIFFQNYRIVFQRVQKLLRISTNF